MRKQPPQRTCTQVYTRYTAYKSYLQNDFHNRCGYCDDLDIYCGGSAGFHIDHFRPHSKFNHLKTAYTNLVYACPYCNRGKSNDWPTGLEEISHQNGKGYVDPCDADYDNHFERLNNGKIHPTTDVGIYMFEQLKLGLRRHELAWLTEQAEQLAREVLAELNNLSHDSPVRRQALEHHHAQLTHAYFMLKDRFTETLK